MAKKTKTVKKDITPKRRALNFRFYLANGDYFGLLTYAREEIAEHFPEARVTGGCVYLSQP